MHGCGRRTWSIRSHPARDPCHRSRVSALKTLRRDIMAVQSLDGTVVDRPRSEPVRTLWGTMIGKKVVMAVTGFVLIGFVIAHMLGNLKIFLGAETIDTYAAFLRTMGEPLLPYGALLWVVRLVLLTCVALHITAAVQLTRMNWAARP